MKSKLKKTLEELLDKAKQAQSGGDALHYTQAVLNLTNAAHSSGVRVFKSDEETDEKD